MPGKRRDYEYFEENSASAILRIAILVAVADGEFDRAEDDTVRRVYEDICVQLGHDEDSSGIRERGRQLSSDLAEEIRDVMKLDAVDDYLELCANDITDKDLQEVAILAALGVAGGDHHFAHRESECLTSFCNHWDISLHDVIEPYLKYKGTKRSWVEPD